MMIAIMMLHILVTNIILHTQCANTDLYFFNEVTLNETFLIITAVFLFVFIISLCFTYFTSKVHVYKMVQGTT